MITQEFQSIGSSSDVKEDLQ